MIELRDREYDPETKEIYFTVYKDGIETAWIVVYDRGEELNVQDIFPSGGQQGNIIGVIGIRQLFRLLKKEFPHAIRLTGVRYGGAKHLDEDETFHEVSYRI